ncbi:MAG: nuclear transport factor 2 family protein [Acidobacteriota bacterium]|nr:nuclear transport factor 2 family protein [Acidobacteriota bacterium]
MKLVSCSVFNFLFLLLAVGGALSQVPAPDVSDPSLRAFLPRFEEGISRFINGDPVLWKQNASRRDDATIMGAWGAHERGWNEVGPRYDWAAARFRESGAEVEVEYLSSGISGDLAYTVSVERSEVRLVGQDKPAPMALRVTHVLRKEDGVWKLVHRHADPLIGKTRRPLSCRNDDRTRCLTRTVDIEMQGDCRRRLKPAVISPYRHEELP